jgi:hypothetical protein
MVKIKNLFNMFKTKKFSLGKKLIRRLSNANIIQPANTTQPVQTTNTTQPVQTTNPAQPVQTINSTQPVQTINSTQPQFNRARSTSVLLDQTKTNNSRIQSMTMTNANHRSSLQNITRPNTNQQLLGNMKPKKKFVAMDFFNKLLKKYMSFGTLYIFIIFMNYMGYTYGFYNSTLSIWLYWFMIFTIELIIIYSISQSIVFDTIHFNDIIPKANIVKNIKRVSSFFQKNAVVPHTDSHNTNPHNIIAHNTNPHNTNPHNIITNNTVQHMVPPIESHTYSDDTIV